MSIPAARERELEIRTAMRKWLDGEPPLPYIQLLVEADRFVEATATARLVLADPYRPGRRDIEAFLEQIDKPPVGWKRALHELARNPTLEGWDALMRFSPGKLAYNRQRNALRQLKAFGADPNWLFRFATHRGITPEAIELVEEGLVTPETILARNAKSRGVQAFFLGLAAESTFLRGDLVGTIRLLREAYCREDDLCSPGFSVVFIRERASDEQNAWLDNARIPRF
jgi:hypothetical protein